MSSQFNDDFPFEKIADHPTLSDAGVQALGEWVGRFPHKASATKAGLEKFCRLLENVNAPWKEPLLAFIQDMRAGKYRREFKKLCNRRAGGFTSPESSQTKELFSFFTQALYSQTLERELGLDDQPAV